MYQFKVGVAKHEHDSFILQHPLCNLLQSSSWAEVKDNWESTIVGVYKEQELVASSLVLIKHLPLGYTMFYTPRGPVMDYKNKELVRFFITNLKQYAKSRKCLFIKMDPGIHVNDYPIQTPTTNYYDVSVELENLKHAGVKHLGYATSIADVIQPRYQANVYRNETFEEQLPRHTKRLLKDAIRHNVKVVKADVSRIQAFREVVALTEERKQVSLRNQEYFSKLMHIYGDAAHLILGEVNIKTSLQDLQTLQTQVIEELALVDEKSRKKKQRLNDQLTSINKSIDEFSSLHIESDEPTIIAGVLSIRFGDTMEMLYAGMDDRFKKFMPQYLLYVEQMKEAFTLGCNYCNMGGVEGDLQDGLSKFKSNFNPMINEFIGEFDVVVLPIRYKIFTNLLKLYKKIR